MTPYHASFSNRIPADAGHGWMTRGGSSSSMPPRHPRAPYIYIDVDPGEDSCITGGHEPQLGGVQFRIQFPLSDSRTEPIFAWKGGV